MAKTKNPLFGFDARGTLGKALAFRHRGQQTIAEKKPIPKDAKTSGQLAWRTMYQLCADLWRTLTDAEKATWETLARRQHMTGYAYYLSQCLRPNPGIYLPLAGGTMSGNISMGANNITNQGNFKIIRKTIDQVVNNTSETQDDDELFLPLAANEVWFFILLPIVFSSDTAGLDTEFTTPEGANLYGWVSYKDADGTLASEPIIMGQSWTGLGIGDNCTPMIFFGLVINSDTPGNLQFKWAQKTPEESDTIVRANSYIMAWKIA